MCSGSRAGVISKYVYIYIYIYTYVNSIAPRIPTGPSIGCMECCVWFLGKGGSHLELVQRPHLSRSVESRCLMCQSSCQRLLFFLQFMGQHFMSQEDPKGSWRVQGRPRRAPGRSRREPEGVPGESVKCMQFVKL